MPYSRGPSFQTHLRPHPSPFQSAAPRSSRSLSGPASHSGNWPFLSERAFIILNSKWRPNTNKDDEGFAKRSLLEEPISKNCIEGLVGVCEGVGLVLLVAEELLVVDQLFGGHVHTTNKLSEPLFEVALHASDDHLHGDMWEGLVTYLELDVSADHLFRRLVLERRGWNNWFWVALNLWLGIGGCKEESSFDVWSGHGKDLLL